MNLKSTFLIIISIISLSCKKEEKQISTKKSVEKDTLVVQDKPVTESPRDQVQHLFSANGGSVLYLKNGEIKGQARFDTDGDFITELMKTKTYGNYIEHDDYVIGKQRGDTTFFFNEFGRIDEGWNIIKGISIENPMQIVSYKSPKNLDSKEIETISETRLIIFDPETKTFKDENSPEADAYFTAMDDWSFYSYELSEGFGKLGIQTKHLSKRYLSINSPDRENVIIDTKSKINGNLVLALLYRKGKMPIIIHLIFNDNNIDEVKAYLN
ncbi:hypothetical protein [Epilithonimonas lactis]|uniref:Uncharacterized protein n=1 Tax=Epilithonimonas lactis TaxID=421072 RepID=A0A085B6M3_9FLAO|nr:hypothetical protein [Epilithonimonas lactis]KFC18118.1 hypothetical protein IO89_18480 [Epilithonimonas lactis]SER11426.1 hypothetical protein SAMN04488097_3941 [Epilithonimonas lactis]